MTWNLAFYQTPRGERPAAVFVEELPEPARAEVAALLIALRERGNLLRPPHSKALGEGLFELRSVKHAVRVFYMFQRRFFGVFESYRAKSWRRTAKVDDEKASDRCGG